MPFDDVFGYPVSQSSGVAAAANAAADVARSVAEAMEQRHDAATCCGARPVDATTEQNSDVGKGWRELGPDEILREGDEVHLNGWGATTWRPTAAVGLLANEKDYRYRRRVTPEVADIAANEQVCANTGRLPEAPQARLAATWAAAHRVVVEALAAEQEEVKKLRSEVKRLRLRPEELDALSWCRDVLPKMKPCAVVQIHSEFCGKMLMRLAGGGE